MSKQQITLDQLKTTGTPSGTTYLTGTGSWSTPGTTLAALEDVDMTSVANGNTLVYNQSTSEWVASEIQVGISQITATGTPTASTYLTGDGSWTTPGTATVAALGDVDMASAVDGDVLVYDSATSNWVASNIDDLFAYEISHWVNGAPVSSEIFLKALFVRAVTFPQNFTGSLARAGIAATGTVVVEILKNGINVGSITYGPGVTTGLYSSSGILSFAVGDQLALRAPIITDATFSDPVFAITGTIVR